MGAAGRQVWKVAPALGVALVLAGCTIAGEPTTAPRLPAPTRALVGWADSMCTTVQSIDGLRTAIDGVNEAARNQSIPELAGYEADSYLNRTPRDVDSAVRSLREIERSGNRKADGYVDGLRARLETMRGKLAAPDPGTTTTVPAGEKLTKARDMAKVIATVEPQRPELTTVVRGDGALAASHNLAPNCAPIRLNRPPAASAPTKSMVTWSETMCRNTTDSLQRNPADDPLLADPRFAQLQSLELSNYITSAGSSLSRIEQALAPLAETGVPEADRYRSELLAAIRAALPKLPQDQFSSGLFNRPVGQLVAQANNVAKILDTVRPQGPDLPTLVGRNDTLTAAYNLAPGCTPIEKSGSSSSAGPAPLPPARNGTDVGACTSGACQITVAEPVDVTVSGLRFSITVRSGTVVITDDSSVLQVGQGGTGQVGNGDTTVQFKVTAVRDDTAVLDISTR